MKDEQLLTLDRGHDRLAGAKYERLKNHLVSQMISGNLKPGQTLPSEQRMMDTFGVGRSTVRQTMASLENDGLIRRVQGKGSFVEADAQRKLKRGQDIFALIVPQTRGGYYPSLLHGFESAAGNLRHQTIICNTDNDIYRQSDVVLQLLDKEVGGVAINPVAEPPTPAYQVRQLQKRGIPVVFCHRRVEGVVAPLLAIRFRDAGYLAGKVLIEHGHRRVAYFGFPRGAVQAYEEGLQEALHAGGGDAPDEFVYNTSPTVDHEEDLLEALKRMFAQPNPPTAIFACFDSTAEMLYLLLPQVGLRVPQDVSLVGFGGAWREGAVTRRLTSVVVDEVDVGQKAASLLHEMRSGDRAIDDNTEIVMELGLSDGETLGTVTRDSPKT